MSRPGAAEDLHRRRLSLLKRVHPGPAAERHALRLAASMAGSPVDIIDRCYADLKARSLRTAPEDHTLGVPAEAPTLMDRMDTRFFEGLPDDVVIKGHPGAPEGHHATPDAAATKMYPTWYSQPDKPPTTPWTLTPDALPTTFTTGDNGKLYPPQYSPTSDLRPAALEPPYPRPRKAPRPALQTDGPPSNPRDDAIEDAPHDLTVPAGDQAENAIGSVLLGEVPDTPRRTSRLSRKADSHAQQAAVAIGEDQLCGFCGRSSKDEPEAGEMLGPFATKRGRLILYVHAQCALWTPECFLDEKQNMRNVYDGFIRGKGLSCSACRKRGATVGCYNDRCRKVYHFTCMARAKCTSVPSFYYAFCQSHAHLASEPVYLRIMQADAVGHLTRAQNMRDTTWGLDCPHSRYTALRRNETETVFSRVWMVTSIRTADSADSARGVYSHKLRCLLDEYDRFQYRSRLRAVRKSFYSMVNGDYYRKNPKTPHSSKPFLLRSFHRSSTVPKRKLTIVEPVFSSSARDCIAGAVAPERKTGTSAGPPAAVLPSAGPLMENRNAASDANAGLSLSASGASGWQVFLAEHLPKELSVRPKDSKGAVMMNLARKWSVMKKSNRKRYEAQAQLLPTDQVAPHASVIDVGNSQTANDPTRVPHVNDSAECGLFKVSETAVTEREEDTTSTPVVKTDELVQAQKMMRPRKRSQPSGSGDMDDIFPAILDDLEYPAQKVRKPPPPVL